MLPGAVFKATPASSVRLMPQNQMNQLLRRALTMKKNIVIMRKMKLKTNAKTAVKMKTKKLRINKSLIELFSR